MGLKCSVLGHAYGETTIEREREEQGSEVVITIQETETCERCGETRVVSENKEVTAIETPSDIAGDMVDDEGEDTDPATGADEGAEDAAGDEEGTDDVAVSHQGSDAEFIGEGDTGSVSDGEDEDTDDGFGDAPTEPGAPDDADVEGDDAEIIDGSDDGGDAADSELDDPTTDVSVPDAEDDPTETEADPETDDGVIIDESDSGPTEEGDREPGQWPSEPDDDGEDWSPEMLTDDPGESDDAGDADRTRTTTAPGGEFRCPECGFTTDAEASSLRAGDFCPECHKGSLVTDTE